MQFDTFLSWGFTGLISGILIYGVKVLQDIKASVEELNKRMATIIEKTSWHEKEMEKINGRIDNMERNLLNQKLSKGAI
jgi:chaperonin cofactor prefoldin